MKAEKNIATLILAAGQSIRMGEHVKQLLAYNDTNLLGNAIKAAQASTSEDIYVVLGAHNQSIQAQTDLTACTVILNHDWNNGLGSSITAGITYFESMSLHYDAVLITLADQPLIDYKYLNRMVELWQADSEKIITTHYQSRSGVPAIFGKEHFNDLLKLNKDFGAKNIIAANKDVVTAVDPEGKAFDIDTWEAYQNLLNNKLK